MIKLNSTYVRNIVFGAEDSLVSTVGVLFGMATAETDLKQILLVGLLVIMVEAVSMGAGAYLSEKSEEEISLSVVAKSSVSGILMFFSYTIAGFLTLLPYLFFEISLARYISIIVALVGLFLVGFIPSKKLSSGIRMLVVAGSAIAVGFIVGKLFNIN